eukprot:TRINITY_DN5974_c0_g1_i8.p1 TRINITY_DN5974_c0_g1~~TRINITY_DN5974_c0_g1_i8.p1  ORF type:complete len:374 (-),score=116.29 TRINITY_DN5974_c0_g1_i8:26-1147(-)
MFTSLPNHLLLLVVLLNTCMVEAKPKAKGSAEPGPWDWQNEASNYPVFNPYPVSKPEQPEFMKINRNIAAVVGETAFLPCRVKNLDENTVSWIRADDVTVLSVGHLAFSSDSRISVVQVARPRLSASDWNLSIENVSLVDDGMYECQVNTNPKINYKVHLKVTDPSKSAQADSPYYDVVEPAPGSGFEQTHSVIKKHHKEVEKEGFSMFLHEDGCICPKPQFAKHNKEPKQQKAGKENLSLTIPGGSIQYVSSGEGVMLECLISGLASPPMSIYWEKGSKVMTVKERSGVSMETEKMAGVSRSSLYIARTELSDTGNYSCVSDALTEAVLLVVTQDEEAQASLARATVSSGGSTVIASMAVITVLAIVMAVTA